MEDNSLIRVNKVIIRACAYITEYTKKIMQKLTKSNNVSASLILNTSLLAILIYLLTVINYCLFDILIEGLFKYTETF